MHSFQTTVKFVEVGSPKTATTAEDRFECHDLCSIHRTDCPQFDCSIFTIVAVPVCVCVCVPWTGHTLPKRVDSVTFRMWFDRQKYLLNCTQQFKSHCIVRCSQSMAPWPVVRFIGPKKTVHLGCTPGATVALIPLPI